jgi:hypothetical protein
MHPIMTTPSCDCHAAFMSLADRLWIRSPTYAVLAIIFGYPDTTRHAEFGEPKQGASSERL